MRSAAIFFILTLFTSIAFGSTHIGCGKSYSFLVFEEASGNILFEEKSSDLVYPASLVKLMTLYLTFEAIEHRKFSPAKVLRVSAQGEEIANVNKINTLHLREGDKITVREAIQAVIVKSFNEAAVTLAEAVSGSEWEFVRQMNRKAGELGMYSTSFRNASGLHEEGQYTTSYDLARLVIALQRNFPGYYHLFALRNFTYRGTKYDTHNHILVEYKWADGLKTGFTNASGFNLISAAKKNGKHIVSVLLGCSSAVQRDQFTTELLNDAFTKLTQNPRVDMKIIRGFNYAKSQNRRDEHEEKTLNGF